MNRMFFLVLAVGGWFAFAVLVLSLIGQVPTNAEPLTTSAAWGLISTLALLMFVAFIAGADQAMKAFEALEERNQELADGLCDALDVLHEIEDETAIYLRTRGDARALHVIDEAQDVLRASGRGIKGFNPDGTCP
ncbi:hypothetical protein [Roseateles chitosanitabidus]|uniref:hypothetical protein n=1 Tax=Roseateles chitosanitabidus TaxID=65048 RepID=UPI00082F3D4C|nr:hypothetical protein [Roseateles chitosanitabidus]